MISLLRWYHFLSEPEQPHSNPYSLKRSSHVPVIFGECWGELFPGTSLRPTSFPRDEDESEHTPCWRRAHNNASLLSRSQASQAQALYSQAQANPRSKDSRKNCSKFLRPGQRESLQHRFASFGCRPGNTPFGVGSRKTLRSTGRRVKRHAD